jgi:integrase
MAYTGDRINELAQLRKEDVQAENGVPFLGITGGTEKGHEIKTSASRRKVPVHRALVAEGFLKFVA